MILRQNILGLGVSCAVFALIDCFGHLQWWCQALWVVIFTEKAGFCPVQLQSCIFFCRWCHVAELTKAIPAQCCAPCDGSCPTWKQQPAEWQGALLGGEVWEFCSFTLQKWQWNHQFAQVLVQFKLLSVALPESQLPSETQLAWLPVEQEKGGVFLLVNWVHYEEKTGMRGTAGLLLQAC